MELLLERTDLVQVGTVSYRNTMKLISGGKSGRQRLVVGDDLGYVECFEIKKGEPQSVFKQRVSTEGPVMALAIGGVAGKNDRVFAAQSQTIVGLKRKGAQCFKMQSSLVEPIHHMAVDESLLFTGCEYVYNRYDDGRDDGFFMCHDKINAMVVRPKPGGGGHRVVLGCQDRTRRPSRSASARSPGGVGLLRIGSEGKYSGVVWHVEDTKALHSRVNCIDVFDVTHDGIPDVVVGRADGRVQVYSFDVSPVPLVQFEANLNEAIHSLCCGSVSSTGFDEIGGAPGKTVAEDRTDNRLAALKEDVAALAKKIERERARFQDLDAPFAPCRPTFEPHADFFLDPEAACYVVTIELPVPVDLVSVKSSVRVELLETALNTSIVSRSPVDPRHETAKEPIVLLATFRCQEATNALSFKVRTVEGEPGDIAAVVVARGTPKSAQVVHLRIKALSLHRRIHELSDDEVRLPKNVLRLEGRFSAQQIHDWLGGCLPEVPPRTQPREVSTKPPDEADGAKPAADAEAPAKPAAPAPGAEAEGAELVAKATGSLASPDRGGGEEFDADGGGEAKDAAGDGPEAKDEAKDDDAPPASTAPPPEVMAHRMCFRNVYTAGVLECDYEAGRARICSDSISAITILKEHISREAVRLRVEVHDTISIDEQTVAHFLALMHPKLDHQLKLAEQVLLIDAIKEIHSSEEDTRWLSEDYKFIHDHAEELRAEFAESPTSLQYMAGIITDFFVDRMKFCGIDARHKIPQLENLLNAKNYDFDKLLEFFNPALHRG
ncbi:hypothetical protein JL722_1826 [Aureococcus anophagefferens]|nr:hypothetical protein JL722_1826 [Aureococcus anophagefferens]